MLPKRPRDGDDVSTPQAKIAKSLENGVHSSDVPQQGSSDNAKPSALVCKVGIKLPNDAEAGKGEPIDRISISSDESMDSSSTVDVLVERPLSICGICLESFVDKQPVLLICLHSFCSQCVLSQAKSNSDTETFLCPTCGCLCSLKNATKNTFLYKDVERQPEIPVPESVPEKLCSSCCENFPAIRYCSVCEDYLCNECVNAHKRLRLTKDHKLDEVDITHPLAGASSGQHPIHCEVHTSELIKLYCETCNMLTCRDCQLEKHKNHQYKFIEEAATNEKTALKALQQSLEERGKQLANLKEEIGKQRKCSVTNRKAVMKEILLNQYHMYNLVSSQSHVFVDEVNAFSQMHQKKLKMQQQSAAKMEYVVNHCVRFIDMVTNDDNHFAMLQSQKMIKDCLQSLSKQTIATIPTAIKATFVSSKSALKALSDGLGSISWSSHLEQDANPPSAQSVKLTPTHPFVHSISENRNQDAACQNPNSNDSDVPILQPTVPTNATGKVVTNLNGPSQMPTLQVPNQIPTSLQNNESAANNTRQNALTSPNGQKNAFALYNSLYLDKKTTTETSHQKAPNKIVSSSGTFFVPPHSKGNQQGPQEEMDAASKSARKPSSTIDLEPPVLVDLDYLDRPTGASSIKLTAVPSQTSAPTLSTTNAATEKDEAVQHATDLVMNYAKQLERQRSESKTTAVLTGETKLKIVTQPKIVEIKCDPNEDWCAVCNNGGNLLCCDTCPKVYHLHCHVPELSVEPEGSWKCSLCRDPNTAAVQETGDKTNKHLLQGRELALCEQILLQLFCHQKSVYFREPVNRAVNPDYYKHIRKPMDLGKIKRRLANADGESPYTSEKGMFRDVQRMIINCYVFNNTHSDYSKKASALQGYFFERVLLKFPDAKEYLAKLMAKQKAVLEDVLNLNVDADERADLFDQDESSGDYQDYLWRPGSDDEQDIEQIPCEIPEGNPRKPKRKTSRMSISTKR